MDEWLVLTCQCINHVISVASVDDFCSCPWPPVFFRPLAGFLMPLASGRIASKVGHLPPSFSGNPPGCQDFWGSKPLESLVESPGFSWCMMGYINGWEMDVHFYWCYRWSIARRLNHPNKIQFRLSISNWGIQHSETLKLPTKQPNKDWRAPWMTIKL